jgi:erythromycin esterase-like protein/predicted phosphoribosyltransferase/alpha-beta hydrolase superfamily lysophospholipase
MAPFNDRKQAGELLGRRLKPYQNTKPVVLALPRGGIPVAAEVARALDAPLDILAVKKLGAPGYEELAVGAVSEEGEPAINDDVLRSLERSFGFSQGDFDAIVAAKRAEIREQLEAFREARPTVELKGRTAIVVDDGLATGATMEAAVQVLRARKVKKAVVAVPVGAPDTVARLAKLADEVVCLVEPASFQAVGTWYRDFSQVETEEAVELLRASNVVAGAGHDPHFVRFTAGTAELEGDVEMPEGARALVIFAHGSGSSRRSPRNRQVAKALHEKGLGTFLFDLLTREEAADRRNVFDINLLASRLEAATVFARQRHPGLPFAYFGASTGAGAALVAASRRPEGLFGVVSRGGRVDLAGGFLANVDVPVLLLVGGLDHPVVAATMQVLDRFKLARLEVVNGAGHLFEEPGTMNEVTKLASGWLADHVPARRRAPLKAVTPEDEQVDALDRVATPLRGRGGLERLAERLAGKRVVMLGESTHGTQEFYALRRELSQILLAQFGFRFVAVEGDWPDCQKLNEYARTGRGGSARAVASGFSRWPTWMWANEEAVALLEWMREHRDGRAFSFHGLDVYSLFESIEAVREAAAAVDEELARRVTERYACFEPWARDEIAYARSLLQFPEGCRREVLENLLEMLNLRMRGGLKPDQLFDAQQNARIVRDAEKYYRAMLEGDQSSWNVRDEHMMETLDVLLRRPGGGKAIVWAHNTHIGDYRHTDMASEGYVNLGGLARERYGAEHVALVGFGTYQGEVTAGHAWASREETMTLPPARRGSCDELLHRVAEGLGAPRLALTFDRESREGALAKRIGQRAVGVVYGRGAELSGHNYVPTVLPERYDFFVFVDESSALTSLHRPAAGGQLPETWPVGW